MPDHKKLREHIEQADMLLRRWSVTGEMVFEMAAVRSQLKAALTIIPPDPSGQEKPETTKAEGGGKDGG